MKQVFFSAGLFISLLSGAQIGGDNTFEFINLPFSARAAALGGFTLATKDDDLNLVIQNPAALNASMHNNLSLSYVNYFKSVNYGYTAYARKFGRAGTFAAGLQYIDYGKFIEADETGEITGRFFAAEYDLHFTYAYQIDSNFSVGANLKTIYSVLESYSAFGNALDISAMYHKAKKNFTAVIAIKNLGRQWKAYTKGNIEPLPFEIQAGISKKPKHAPFRLSLILTHLEKWDLTYVDPSNPAPTVDPITNEPVPEKKFKKFADKLARHIHLSGELLLTKYFNLRLAYNYQRRQDMMTETKPGGSGFSFGFGFKVSKFQISYGHGSYHLAGGTNHFTITTNFSEFAKKKNTETGDPPAPSGEPPVPSSEPPAPEQPK